MGLRSSYIWSMVSLLAILFPSVFLMQISQEHSSKVRVYPESRQKCLATNKYLRLVRHNNRYKGGISSYSGTEDFFIDLFY